MTNEMTRSSQPREKPAIRPSTTPTKVEMTVAETRTISEVRSP